jgi:hypothetical protein
MLVAKHSFHSYILEMAYIIINYDLWNTILMQYHFKQLYNSILVLIVWLKYKN